MTYKQNGTTLIGDLTYEYDNAGNRTKIGGSWARTGLPEQITSTTYDANNRQLTFGDKTLTYDDNGNLQTITDSNGTTLYSWNSRNELIGISGPTVSASFVYDAAGRRQKKLINGNLTEFLYDGSNPVQETSGATILANILAGLGFDEFFTRIDVVAGTTSHFLTDILSSPVAVADNVGVVQTEYTYEPFGKTTFNGAVINSSYQYTGRENDGTGVYYSRARYYHPQLQRFISEDPTGFSGGDLNLFSYVHNSPSNFTDPLGLQAVIPLYPYAPPGQLPRNPLSPSQMRDMTEFFNNLRNLLAKTTEGMWGRHLTPEQAAEKQREYEAYKRRCNQQVPGPFPNECAKAKWELQRARDCYNMIVAWELKWDVYHEDEAIQRRNAVSNAEDRVRAACKCPNP
jgi:RHS repeat-associated protein